MTGACAIVVFVTFPFSCQRRTLMFGCFIFRPVHVRLPCCHLPVARIALSIFVRASMPQASVIIRDYSTMTLSVCVYLWMVRRSGAGISLPFYGYVNDDTSILIFFSIEENNRPCVHRKNVFKRR